MAGEGPPVSRKKRNRTPPSSSDEESGKQSQPHIKEFYSDDTFNPRRTNDLVVKEMMLLSVGARNEIIEEIHGVRCMARKETPELVEDALWKMELELARIPPSKKQALVSAQRSDDNNTKSSRPSSCPSCYVNTKEFRLKFLRCELFDAQKAALRMVGYLELMVDWLFPASSHPEILRRPVRLSDFDEEEQLLIRKGMIQLLPFRDRSGRRVLAGVATMGIRNNPLMVYKILFYFLSVAGEDTESQQKGVVFLLWPNPDIAEKIQLRFPIHGGGKLCAMVFRWAPIRIVAYHLCTPANVPFFQVLRSVFAMTLGGSRLSRLKFHSGEPVELRYQISGYGIPVDLLPLTPTGNVKVSYLRHWIRLRATVEEADLDAPCPQNRHQGEHEHEHASNATNSYKTHGVFTMIECPGSLDVVFRPGRPVMNHPGNVAFRSLIESMSKTHETATQTKKSTIVKGVVDEIKTKGGRFLVWDEKHGCWTAILDDNKQRHKVAIAFRNFKSYKKAQGNRQTNTESTMVTAFEKLSHGGSSGGFSSAISTIDNKKRKRTTTCSQGAFCFV